MSIFRLPDLGEGLADAEILEWRVRVGDEVVVDQPLVSVETAKAVVEVPAPRAGRITALHGSPGERIETGAPLVEFADGAVADAGSVVGHMPAATGELAPVAALDIEAHNATLARIRAVPAARALARSLGVQLEGLRGSGTDGLITLADVIAAGLPAAAGPRGARPPGNAPTAVAPDAGGEVEALRSLRRAMARSMTLARDAITSCTVFDDADLHRWRPGHDYTARVLRAIAAACRAQPGLNAWYDEAAESRRLFERIDVGIAVDTPEGLLVPVLRDIGGRPTPELRADLERLKRGAHARALGAEELRHFTFMLSNFGTLAGRYATPVVVPPAVAILGTGRARADAVAVGGHLEVHLRMPLSLTFDHRVVTGGEAVRFLGALITDLELPE
ncbi:MAG: 2-oxo acid dehydrogenase subunit E2 [Gammaproteobacteria bacterium]|nr:2-oxo acid dehydrogenase subunit E2 [Gammaproteobacteria bacterium]